MYLITRSSDNLCALWPFDWRNRSHIASLKIEK